MLCQIMLSAQAVAVQKDSENPGRGRPGFPHKQSLQSVADVDEATGRGHHEAGVNDRAAEAVAEAVKTPVMTPATAEAEAMCGGSGRNESGGADGGSGSESKNKFADHGYSPNVAPWRFAEARVAVIPTVRQSRGWSCWFVGIS
jgi:hypothetical protein